MSTMKIENGCFLLKLSLATVLYRPNGGMSSKKNFKVSRMYVTAFPDKAEFRKNASELAWEIEVWIADEPDHMIHFNGDRFLGPH